VRRDRCSRGIAFELAQRGERRAVQRRDRRTPHPPPQRARRTLFVDRQAGARTQQNTVAPRPGRRGREVGERCDAEHVQRVAQIRGRRIAGPPPRPLDRFYTRIRRGGEVELGPRYSVNSELRRFAPRYSGEPLDGIGQYLYPARPATPKRPG